MDSGDLGFECGDSAWISILVGSGVYNLAWILVILLWMLVVWR